VWRKIKQEFKNMRRRNGIVSGFLTMRVHQLEPGFV
jgi:hypothetical protein